MSKSNLEKLIEYYSSTSDQEPSDELQDYEDRLSYCRDCLKSKRPWDVRKLMIRRYKYSRSTANADIRDTQELFAWEFTAANKSFERAQSIYRLSKYRQMAENTAKSPKDWEYVSKIEMKINDLMGLNEPDVKDPGLIIPGAIFLQLPTGGRPKVLNLDEGNADPETIELIEGMHYSVDDMRKQLEKGNNESDKKEA